MNGVLEQLLLYVLKQLVTPDVVKEFEKQVVAKFRELAKQTDNKVDDAMVDVIAAALGVQG